MLRTVRKIALSAVILAVIFLAAGALYVLFVGNKPVTGTKASTSTASQYNPLPKPRAPNPKNPVGVAEASLLSPVSAGSNSSLTIHTTPQATCTISLSYDTLKSTDSGLVTKVADQYGQIIWTWTVPKNAPAGTWPIKILCKYLTHSGYLESYLQVTK